MTAEGRAWEFNVQEQRDMQYLDRQAGLETGNRQNQLNMQAQRFGIMGQMIPNAISAGVGTYTAGQTAASDRKLKKNIKLIGYSPSGLKIYAFEYIDKAFGNGLFQGVMSDEIPQSAVTKHQDGYDRVDYSQLDVEFKII
jgi:hypothetical protein